MPRRTIYVSESDQELFERAAQEPGGLSPTVAIALNEYMARAVLRNEGMEVIVHIFEQLHPEHRFASTEELRSALETYEQDTRRYFAENTRY